MDTSSKSPASTDESERARTLADVERRINEARAAVFAKDDGVVGKLMTDLEREWRELSRLERVAPSGSK